MNRTKIHSVRPPRLGTGRTGGLVRCVLAVPLCALSAAHGQLVDGNFDLLAAGTAPDCLVPAGAWQFPPNYVQNGLCEPDPTGFTIVETSSFDPTRSGRSLHVNIPNIPSDGGFHITNILPVPISPQAGQTIRCTFEIFVKDTMTGGAGELDVVIVYIGADMGGGGAHPLIDRGPQLSWFGDGRLQCPPGHNLIPADPGYPRNQWQSVRFDIHLGERQRYDLYWAPTGQPLLPLGADLPFRSTGTHFDHIERLSVAHFDVNGNFVSDCYLDNFKIELVCDANCDESTTPPVLNVLDFSCFLNRFAAGNAQANCDGSTTPPTLNVLDFSCFLNAFAAGCN